MSDNATDWIKPGAEVVVYRDTYTGVSGAKKTTVLKVAAKSFTLDGVNERIQLDDLASKNVGSSYSGWRYRVVRPDSEKARQLFAAARRSRIMGEARDAVDAWQKSRTPENRLAAIEALQKVED